MFKNFFNINKTLFFIVFFFIFIGLYILADASAVSALENFGRADYYLLHQIFFGFLPGFLLGLIIIFFLPLSFFKKYSLFFIVFSLILMILVFVPPFRTKLGGAYRWLNLGFFNFQPSELLKLSFIIYLSAWLANRVNELKIKKKKNDWKKTSLPFVFIVIFIFLIFFLQRNASDAILISGIAVLLYFLSGIQLRQVLLISFLFLLIGGLFIFCEPYRRERIMVAFNLIDDPLGKGFQTEQALITVGSGGIWGKGLGMSEQKYSRFLPQIISDSIFPIFAEETGFVGSLFLILLINLFFINILIIAIKTKDKFSQLCAMGIGAWFFFQFLVNIGAMIKIFPLTGIPLPFISYGGSHILVEMLGLALLFNISRQNLNK